MDAPARGSQNLPLSPFQRPSHAGRERSEGRQRRGAESFSKEIRILLPFLHGAHQAPLQYMRQR
jgi:hypothetical protein